MAQAMHSGSETSESVAFILRKGDSQSPDRDSKKPGIIKTEYLLEVKLLLFIAYYGGIRYVL